MNLTFPGPTKTKLTQFWLEAKFYQKTIKFLQKSLIICFCVPTCLFIKTANSASMRNILSCQMFGELRRHLFLGTKETRFGPRLTRPGSNLASNVLQIYMIQFLLLFLLQDSFIFSNFKIHAQQVKNICKFNKTLTVFKW